MSSPSGYASIAFADSDDLHAAKRELLKEPGDMLLVTADAVEGLGQDNIKAFRPRIGEQLLIDRAEMVRSALRVIGIGTSEVRALPT